MTEDTERRMRYLFVFYMAGGNATIFQNLREGINVQANVDSDWLPIEVYPRDLIARIPPFSLNGTLANSTVTRLRIRKLEKQGKPYDAAYFFQHTTVTLLKGLRRRIPHLIAMDGTPMWYAKNELWYAHPFFDPEKPVSRLKHSITQSVYAGAYRLLPLSEGVRQSLIEDYHIPSDRVIVIPPGIDLLRYQNPDRIGRQKPGPKKVLFVGADFIRKGGDVVIAAAKREELKNVEFHIVTKSFEGDRSQNVIVHSDISADSNEMLAVLRDADLFVLPTRADSHSIASLEAMAMGLPVLATKVGGIADIIVPGETGYFSAKEDVPSLAGQIQKLLMDDGCRLQMGKNARKRVEERFNLATNVRLVAQLMEAAARTRHSVR